MIHDVFVRSAKREFCKIMAINNEIFLFFFTKKLKFLKHFVLIRYFPYNSKENQSQVPLISIALVR